MLGWSHRKTRNLWSGVLRASNADCQQPCFVRRMISRTGNPAPSIRAGWFRLAGQQHCQAPAEAELRVFVPSGPSSLRHLLRNPSFLFSGDQSDPSRREKPCHRLSQPARSVSRSLPNNRRSPVQMPQLSVLTFNIWGLWLVSKRREERVRQIAEYLRKCKEDVVLLQEVWVDADAQVLIKAGKAAGLLHCTHFRSGMFGAGLVTLSRHPIIRHQFWRYAAAGFASSITCGDYYAGKGVGWVRLSTPLGEVDVFNTHLHANYCHAYRQPPPELAKSTAAATASITGDAATGDGASGMVGYVPAWHGSRIADDDDAGTRISQLLELSELISIIASSSCSSDGSSRHIILGGDLNCKPDTLEIDLLRMRLPDLSDAWASTDQRSSHSSNGNSDEDSKQQQRVDESSSEGFTCHAPGNTFQPKRQVKERIDYIWSNMSCSKAEVTLQMSPAGISYSDHFAVRATLLPRSAAAAATAESKAMKLGPSSARSASQQQQQQQQGSDVGSLMSVPKQIATVMASDMLLKEGIQSFSGSAYTLSTLGAFLLTSVVYSAVALPLLMPDMVFKGLLLITPLMISIGSVAVLGLVFFLMGRVADKSQKRALQNAYRLLRVWMQQEGLEAGAGAAADSAAGDAVEVAAAAQSQ